MNELSIVKRCHRQQQREDRLRLRLYLLGLTTWYQQLKAFFMSLMKLRIDRQALATLNRASLLTGLWRLPKVLLETLFLILLFWLGFLFKTLPRLLLRAFPRSLAEWLKVVVIAMFLLVGASATGLYIYLSAEPDPQVLQHYIQAHQYRTAVAMRDANGHLIGALPSPKASPDARFNHEQRQGALYVDTIPPVFWDVLIAREDRDLDFNYQQVSLWDIFTGEKSSYKGINIMALFKRPLESTVKGNDVAGGSALINLIIKNLYGMRYFNEQYGASGIRTTLQRKLEEIRGARNLFPYLAENNGQEFKRWIAMHAPLLLAGGDVYGIRSASATLFGKRPHDLSDAEQAVLAAAYHRSVRFQPLSSDSDTAQLREWRLARWQKLISKAKKGVENAYQANQSTKMKAILAELAQMQTPQVPKMPSSLTQLLQDKSFAERQKYGNLKQRTHLLAASLKSGVMAQLKQQDAQLSAQQVITDIQLTLAVSENDQFKKQLNKTFAAMHRYCPSCYNKTIGAPVNDSANGALVRISVADENGNMVRYYRRGHVYRRPIASISKIAATVLLAQRGVTADTLFCNKAYQGRRNASGPNHAGVANCMTPDRSGHAFSFYDTLARSKNLPLFYALTDLKAVSKEDLLTLYRRFGLHDSASLNGTTATAKQLAFELSFGLAEATPATTHQIIQTLTQQLYRPHATNAPHLVKSVTISEYDATTQKTTSYKKRLTHPNRLTGIQSYLSNDRVKAQLKKILAAPVVDKKGTLHRFSRLKDVRFLLNKSGTSEANNGKTRDKWAVGSFELKGRLYTYSIVVGTDDMSNGLGSRVTHGRVMYPIMRDIVESLR